LPECVFDSLDIVDSSKLAAGEQLCLNSYQPYFQPYQEELNCCEFKPIFPVSSDDIYEDYTAILEAIMASGNSVSYQTIENVLQTMLDNLLSIQA
jgi:hypothetical protein